MSATQHVHTIDLERQRKTAKFIAGLLGTLSWIIAIVAVVVFFVILVIPTILPLWAGALVVVFSLIGGGLLFLLAEEYKRRYLEKAGYGVKTLENSGATLEANMAVFTLLDRKVVADVVRTVEFIPARFTVRSVEAHYTRIRVQHKGKIPYVIQLPLWGKKRLSFLNKDVYLEWKKEPDQNHFQPMPKNVRIKGRVVLSALPEESIPTLEERVERVLNDPNVTALQGLITIEPDQVLWWQRKDMLPQERLENAVNVLVGIAQRIEKEYQTWSLEEANPPNILTKSAVDRNP